MKNTNITLHTTQKKEYVLTGILSLPLHLGERAWIYSYNQTLGIILMDVRAKLQWNAETAPNNIPQCLQ